MIIREETPADKDAITEVTVAAFADHPHSRGGEQFIIAALRASGALSLSLVAEEDGRVAGHIAFSPVELSGREKDWYGVGPISVAPGLRRRGIGSALVREGLERLEKLGAAGCMLVGDPAFYSRFGFRNRPGLVLDGVPPEVFLALPFRGGPPRGTAVFHEAFAATA
jgi:putative acetyltransferase